MMNLQMAKTLIDMEQYTLIALKNTEEYKSNKHGIIPILTKINEDKEFLKEAEVPDLVVGKAAAFLYAYAGIKTLYANTISTHAISVLEAANIEYSYTNLVDYIINRAGDDMCPMEKSVLNLSSPEQAYTALYNKIFAQK